MDMKLGGQLLRWARSFCNHSNTYGLAAVAHSRRSNRSHNGHWALDSQVKGMGPGVPDSVRVPDGGLLTCEGRILLKIAPSLFRLTASHSPV